MDNACKPVPDVEEALKELCAEREIDEERLEQKIGLRRGGLEF